jgi:hypothetical protein
MSQNECWKRHRCGVRLERAWRHVEDQPLDLSATTSLQFRGYHFKVPIMQKGHLRIKFQKGSVHEGVKVIPNHGLIFGWA